MSKGGSWRIRITSRAAEIEHLGRSQLEMIAELALQLQRARRGEDAPVAQEQIARQIVEQAVAALEGLQPQDEARIRIDIDALDGIHLDGDGEAHGAILQFSCFDRLDMRSPFRARRGRRS